MMQRQSREQARLQPFRMLQPGEIDHEIDVQRLTELPVPEWDPLALAACTLLHDRYIMPETGNTIPEHAFCDLPRWVFLEYLIRFHDLLLIGSNEPDLPRLEPVVLSQNLHEWNQPRYFAFSNSMDALFHAVLDRHRLRELDCPVKSTLAQTVETPEGSKRWKFYYGIDYRALPHAPWCSGTIYLYRKTDFSADFQIVPDLTNRSVRPLAKITVSPWDWPLLDKVCGVNVAGQTERQRETFRGYPWSDDVTIHPHLGDRPLVEQVRTYLEAHFADPIDLAQLGQIVGLSPFALLRRFRAHFGLSPKEFQTLRRVAEAKRLLRNGLPIAQVAAETGFCDQTHLNRAFRQIVGLTPGRYLRVQESPIRYL